MSIPAGWSRTRVFLAGTGPVISNTLQNPIRDVVFATLISSSFDSTILAIDGLNQSRATACTQYGVTSKFNYFIAAVAANQNETPRFPTGVFYGQTFSELTARWLTQVGAPAEITVSTNTYVELELWSYSN
jgi:hypothetical protein